MGRPFQRELAELAATYSWARAADISSLSDAVQHSRHLPLLAIGSGGSLTCAHFAALLHRHATQKLGLAITPLDAGVGPDDIRSCAALVVSASGRNADVVAAFDLLHQREPAILTAFCARERSVLAERVATGGPPARLAELLVPTGKDGFLATNSLLAMMTALARAYALAPLPETLGTTALDEADLAGVVEQDTLVTLHGQWGAPVAVDIESKFTEAALGHVQLADYRNFAHGRHHWFAKHPKSAIVAVVTPECRALAEATLALLPPEIPRVILATPMTGPAGTLDLLVQSWALVKAAGDCAGIDPGRPGVPQFGRKLYHLKAKKYFHRPEDPPVSVERKLSALGWSPPGTMALMKEGLADFRARLVSTAYQALMLDYDGTVCAAERRFDGPDTETGQLLNDVLGFGLPLGFATGRGDSARTDLQRVIDRRFWPQVIIGYHNAGSIGALSDAAAPGAESPTPPELAEANRVIQRHPLLSRMEVKVSAGVSQVSVRSSMLESARLRDVVAGALAYEGLGRLEVVQSSHSVDVLAPGVGKLNLFRRMCEMVSSDAVLCIGDRGAWPGNDYAMLGTRYSLSVDEVGPEPGTCWNLAPRGVRGVPALRWYLRQLVQVEGGVKLELKE